MVTSLFSLGHAYIKSFTGLSSACFKRIFIQFLVSSLTSVFYFLPLYFADDLHLTVATSGSVIACYGIGAILGGFLGGKGADRFSPGSIAIVSLALQALNYFLLIHATTLPLLAGNIFLLGFATYAYITANTLCVLAYCETTEIQKIKGLNLLTTASNLGFGLSSALMSLLLPFGFTVIFQTTAGLLLVLSLFLFGLQRTETLTAAAVNIATTIQKPMTKNYVSILLTLFCVLFVGAVVAQLSSNYALYIRNTFPHYGVKGVSILFTLNALLVILLATPMSHLTDRYHKMTLLGISGFFICIGMLLLIFQQSFLIPIVACIIFTLGENVFFSVAQFICYQQGLQKKKGQSLGFFRMTYASSRILGPFGGGMIFGHFGGSILWLTCGFIGGICLILCLLIPFFFKI